MNEQLQTATPAIYMTEALMEIDSNYDILSYLTKTERDEVLQQGTQQIRNVGQHIFTQTEAHNGIFIIHSGRVRTYYASASGREITLAYWTPGHFVGGPEIFGGSIHMWSAVALVDSTVTFLPANRLRYLMLRLPNLAIGLIDGLVYKGKSYSSLLQILGTQPARGRLAHLLLTLAERQETLQTSPAIFRDRLSNDELANMIGATRQWVATCLQRFKEAGLITFDKHQIIILNSTKLREIYD